MLIPDYFGFIPLNESANINKKPVTNVRPWIGHQWAEWRNRFQNFQGVSVFVMTVMLFRHPENNTGFLNAISVTDYRKWVIRVILHFIGQHCVTFNESELTMLSVSHKIVTLLTCTFPSFNFNNKKSIQNFQFSFFHSNISNFHFFN